MKMAEGRTRTDCLGVGLAVKDVKTSSDFYKGLFGFTGESSRLRFGDFQLDFLTSSARRPVPPDSRSHDAWFRHFAIVVRDMQQAWRVLSEAGVEMISSEPQTLPAWNAESAGIQGLYFLDPDRHPVELIQFPPDKGKAIWHEPGRDLFQGVDHTAIVVRDIAESQAFYCDELGLRPGASAHNFGEEQDRLSGLAGASLRAATLNGTTSFGLELLQYEAPDGGRSMPSDTTPDDLWWSATILTPAANGPRAGTYCHDPDGHGVILR